jgi:exosortase
MISAVLALSFVWAYWTTLVNMVISWSTVADYSHGFLVVPAAALILWLRRDKRPAESIQLHWGGLSLLALAGIMRLASGRLFIEAIDGWSMVVWIAGAVWLVGGLPWLKWSAPAIGFLVFMTPLPFRMEHVLGEPLARIAAKSSTWILQSIGQPALPEGTTIVLGDQRLEVEQACSGLRMFLGVLALAYAYAVFAQRPWWDKAAVIAASVPVAVVANAIRIATTGLFFQIFTAQSAHRVIHEWAGLLTIPLAAAMLAAWSWYLHRLIREVRVLEGRDLVRIGVPKS